MASKIRSVSLSEDEDAFLTDYDLSPTQLLKEKIWEMKGAIKNMTGRRIERLQTIISDYADKIDKLEKQNVVLQQERGQQSVEVGGV